MQNLITIISIITQNTFETAQKHLQNILKHLLKPNVEKVMSKPVEIYQKHPLDTFHSLKPWMYHGITLIFF